jgi:hypothetical protein
MTNYWFKPKTYGYGATPVTWQGWLVTFATLAFLVGLTHFMIVGPQVSGNPPSFLAVIVWAALVAITTFGLVRITRAKTDGAWKWRWGGPER